MNLKIYPRGSTGKEKKLMNLMAIAAACVLVITGLAFLFNKVTVEFLLPNTLNSIQLSGEVVWYRVAQNGAGEREHPHFAGIKFISLDEANRNFICSFSLKLLHDEDLVEQQGIDRVLSDIRNLPPMERQRALDILARKGLISREKRQQLGILDH